MKGISIIVCCYNSKKRLPATLEYLSKQVVAEAIPWEIIIVDNASTDNTGISALEIWDKLCCKVDFTVVSELKPGLTSARHKGYSVAKYDYLLYCDDDNWLLPDYVNIGFSVMELKPLVAILAGRSTAAFEVEAPDWFSGNSLTYAVGQQYTNSGDVTWRYEKLWGAGAIIRKSALTFLFENDFQQLLSGRIGSKITSGEDHELCFALRLAGYRLFYDDRLQFIHYMSAGRLSWKWLVEFYKNAAFSSVFFDAYEKALDPKPNSIRTKLKTSVLYSIYLSLRKIHKIGFIFKKFFYPPPCNGDHVWVLLFYERNRLLSLLTNFFNYKKNVKMVANAKWKNNLNR